VGVAILTDFVNHDPAYSLCGVVANQVRMLVAGGFSPILFVRRGWPDRDTYPGCRAVVLDPGETGSNVVKVTGKSGEEIEALEKSLEAHLDENDIRVVLAHDVIYQPNLWKYHVAVRRIARRRSDVHWLNWVHSSTDMGVARKTKQFARELMGPFPNSTLVVMHQEEMLRKRNLYNYEFDQTVIIPNAIDFTEDYHPWAKELISEREMWRADAIAVYPCRLDRGKQPEIIIEIFGQLRLLGYDARVVIVDFHSVGGDKAKYRGELKGQADRSGVPVYFTSDLGSKYKPAEYHVPHKVVMDLMDYGDLLIHPSKSESDPLILPEAAWKRCGLILNYDLPYFRLYDGLSLLYKFSSNIDIATGLPGETNTNYSNRSDYMRDVAGGCAFVLRHNPVIRLHVQMRQTRSVEAVWAKSLWPVISQFTS